MKRRTFLKTTTAGVATWLIPGSVFSKLPGRLKRTRHLSKADLEDSFLNPPDTGKPFTWWHWMNGNITADGITRDLEFMKEAGIGGFQLFQVGIGIPKGPVKFGSSEWAQLLRHAAKEANRLGLDYDMMNGGGWSSSGGPWITPELSMKQFTWSETFVSGGDHATVQLPQPYTKLGYYEDAYVLAFPSLAGETEPMQDLLQGATTRTGSVDVHRLTDEDLSKGVEISPTKSGQPASLRLEFKKPFTARSIAVYHVSSHHGFFSSIPPLSLEASTDGVNFRKVSDLDVSKGQRGSIEVPATARFQATEAKYFRLVSPKVNHIAKVRLSGAVNIIAWPHKANFAHRVGHESFTSTGVVPANSVIDSGTVMDITHHMGKDGHLNWQAPPGNWTILRIGQTTTGVKNHPAPDGGLGLECDKYDRKAYNFHFKHFFAKLLPFLEALGANGKSGSVIDSYEVGMQTWTKNFPQEFHQRQGYDLKNYLPAMTGRIVDSGDISDRFLWDIRRTDADLMAENYYGQFVDLCHKHNMKAYAEPYSGGPFEDIQSGSELDVPMGEFWVDRGRQDRSIAYSVKMASSLGHLYGQQVVAAESYTGAPDLAKWQQYPYAMKGEGDWMYTHGLNKFVFHVYAMQPHPTAVPGMTMGPFGWMHSRTNTWSNREDAWLKYTTRCQHVLQQGRLVADIVYYNGVKVPVDTAVWPDQLNPMPPKGFYYDVADTKAVMTRMQTKDGRISLPDGMNYRVLVLPDSQELSLEVLQRLQDMVRQGLCLVGPKPERTPGLSGYLKRDAELRDIAGEMWNDLDGVTKTHTTYGKGHVFWGASMDEVMSVLNIQPDFQCTSRSGNAPINYIHRKIGDAEVYFVANRRRRTEELVCTFRVHEKQPELWNPETGEMSTVAIFEDKDGRIRMPLRLDPAGSAFVVFRSKATRPLHKIAKDGKTVLGTDPYPASRAGRYRAVTDTFSISLWVKPDVDISLSTPESFAIYPPAGAKLYGGGHVACGLVAGRNGLAVYERGYDIHNDVTGDNGFANVLSVETPLSGWTHVALVYQAGVSSLYVNGKLAGHHDKSGHVVHPGLHEADQDDGAYYFAGEMSEPQLFTHVLDQSRIRTLANKGIPAPEGPPVVEPIGHSTAALQIWQNGTYSLRDHTGKTTSINITELDQPTEITGPWTVTFPPHLGAPKHVVLKELISLKDHPEDGVKYFSGTATYSKKINVSSQSIAGDNHLVLDLGWVEVMADVRINGKDIGTVWKRPYRVDITDSVHAGENNVEILVTSLWPNRLIGDEYLPEENQYIQGEGVINNGAIKKLPEWYVQSKPKPPGGRVTFATWKHFDKNDPLLESGLLGPVTLRTAVRKEIPS